MAFHQQKNGLPRLGCRLMKSVAAAMVSSSTVSMRFLVSGPVSSMVCAPSASPLHGERHAGRIFLKFRVLRVVPVFRLLLGIEVIEVAEELIEAMLRGQVFVAVALVVLAELAGGVTVALHHRGDGHVRLLPAFLGPGRPTLVMPVRTGTLPPMKAARPAVQLC